MGKFAKDLARRGRAVGDTGFDWLAVSGAVYIDVLRNTNPHSVSSFYQGPRKLFRFGGGTSSSTTYVLLKLLVGDVKKELTCYVIPGSLPLLLGNLALGELGLWVGAKRREFWQENAQGSFKYIDRADLDSSVMSLSVIGKHNPQLTLDQISAIESNDMTTFTANAIREQEAEVDDSISIGETGSDVTRDDADVCDQNDNDQQQVMLDPLDFAINDTDFGRILAELNAAAVSQSTSTTPPAATEAGKSGWFVAKGRGTFRPTVATQHTTPTCTEHTTHNTFSTLAQPLSETHECERSDASQRRIETPDEMNENVNCGFYA